MALSAKWGETHKLELLLRPGSFFLVHLEPSTVWASFRGQERGGSLTQGPCPFQTQDWFHGVGLSV